MKPKMWGSGSKYKEKMEEKVEVKRYDKELDKIRKERRRAKRDTVSIIDWGIILKIVFATCLFIFIVSFLPIMFDVVSDFAESLPSTSRYNDLIPDTTVFVVTIHKGGTRSGRIIYEFEANKLELVSNDVCFVTEEGNLAPIKSWEPWRRYLTNVRGFRLKIDSIYVVVQRAYEVHD